MIVLGDFNIHVNDQTDSSAIKFLELLNSFGLVNHVDIPTHIHGHTIDLIITRYSDNLKIHGVNATYFISDHSFVCAKTQLEKPEIQYQQISYRKLKNIDMTSFEQDLRQSPLCVNTSDDLEHLVSQYHQSIHQTLDTHAPVITKTAKVVHKSAWFTTDLRNLKKERRKLEYKWRKTKLEIDHQAFKIARNKFVQEINIQKVNFYSNEVNKCNGDQRKLYQLVNKLTVGKQESSYPEHSTKKQLANDFGIYFQDKIKKIRTDIEDTLAAENICADISYEQCLNPCDSNLSSFTPLTSDEVKSIVMKCSSKHCPLDPAPTFIIKECITILLPYITKIVNMSLANGHFPTQWKCSLVRPLIKKSDLDPVLSNFRPVSNLEFISKVVETAAIAQYQDYLVKNKQMPSKNAAYSKSQSTETILTRVQSDILCNMDNQHVTILVLLDLSAAFDTLDHGIFLDILKHKFNITGNVSKWFHSYLTGRKQKILVDEIVSDEYELTFGVPQGSCAGPVTFLSYVSSLYDVIKGFDVDIGGFADDSQLYVSFKPGVCGLSERSAVNKMNECVTAVRTWMLQHRLKINDAKTEVIIIGGPQQLNKIQSCAVTVGSFSIAPVSKVKNLGMYFDQNMSMKDHIDKICQVGFHQLYRLRQIRKYFAQKTMESLVHSFITSRIDYGNAMFYGLPDCSINKLQRLQNAAARLIVCKSKRSSISAILKDLHWLPVKYRINYKITLLVFKCLNGCGPKYLCDLLKKPPKTRTLRSSSDSLKLVVPLVKTETFGKRSFRFAAPTEWNELPYHIRNCDNVEHFKKSLKTHYFKQAFT